MSNAATLPEVPRPEPSGSRGGPAPATDDDRRLDRLLSAWRHWQDLRASDVPAWARMAAFESYLAARAAIRRAPAHVERSGDGAHRATADGTASRGDRRRRSGELLGAVLAAAALASVIAVGDWPASPDPTAPAGSGAPPSVAVPLPAAHSPGPNLTFSPGP